MSFLHLLLFFFVYFFKVERNVLGSPYPKLISIIDFPRIKRPVSLPPSLSDEVPISFPHTNEENEDSEEYIDKLDEEEESESETSQSSEESVDEVYLPGMMLVSRK